MDEACRKRLLRKLRGARPLDELGDEQWEVGPIEGNAQVDDHSVAIIAGPFQQALGREVPRSSWSSTKLAGVDRLCWSPDGRVLLVMMSDYETHFLETQHGIVLFSSQLRRPAPSDLRWLPALDAHLDESNTRGRRCFAEMIDCFCTMNSCQLCLQKAFDIAVKEWESKPSTLVKVISSKLLPHIRLLKECRTSLHSALYLLRLDADGDDVETDPDSRFLSTLLSIQSDPSTDFPDEGVLRNSTAASILSDLADDLSSLEGALEKAMRLAATLGNTVSA